MRPGLLAVLTRGGVEHVSWICERPTKRLEFEVRLDATLGRTTPLKVTPHGISQSDLKQSRDGSGWSLRGTALDLPEGYEISLDLDAG